MGKPYDINLDEGFTAIKAQENNNNKRERERRTHTLYFNMDTQYAKFFWNLLYQATKPHLNNR